MIQIAGKLSVRHIKGRKGVFAVGELISEVGNFKVKDSMLDQFDEGEYRGMFQVTRIFPESYIYYGRVVTEIRATLAGIELDGEEIKPVAADVPVEPDPAEHDDGGAQSPTATAASAPVADQPMQAGSSNDDANQGADPDLVLFGSEIYESIQNGRIVKLDPTVDRARFRQQCRRLKPGLGYEFDATTQSWSKLQ